jgi:hypothetical protein
MAMLHSVYDRPDAASVQAQYDRLVDAVTGQLPKVADNLEAPAAAPPGARPTKAAVQDAIRELPKVIYGGITKADSGSYMIRQCCEDWLTDGLPGRDPKTVAKNKFGLETVLAVIGAVRLRDLDDTDVDQVLSAMVATRSSATVAMAHLALTRAITRAQAENLVLRNVAGLTGTPAGRGGRPSCSMTLAQATAVTAAAQAAGPLTHVYVMLSLCTGVRTEEARAPRALVRLARVNARSLPCASGHACPRPVTRAGGSAEPARAPAPHPRGRAGIDRAVRLCVAARAVRVNGQQFPLIRRPAVPAAKLGPPALSARKDWYPVEWRGFVSRPMGVA